jgi:hypothetical protein
VTHRSWTGEPWCVDDMQSLETGRGGAWLLQSGISAFNINSSFNFFF